LTSSNFQAWLGTLRHLLTHYTLTPFPPHPHSTSLGPMATITVTVADEEGNAASLQVSKAPSLPVSSKVYDPNTPFTSLSLLLQVRAQDTVETLKALVETEMRVPRAQQVLLKDGAPIPPGATIAASGVVDNDFLFLVRDRGNGNGGSTSNATSSGSLRSLNDLPPGLSTEQFMSTLQSNPRLLAELQHHNSPLAAAVATGDVVKVRSVQMKQRLQAVASRMEEQQAMQALEANPMDPEAQRKIEEIIQKENVLRNMEMAMEEMPEAFGSVVMLYVDVEVNGYVCGGQVGSVQKAGKEDGQLQAQG